jgi:GDP-4-dehydro-6-deoxy-D-mannose reductase
MRVFVTGATGFAGYHLVGSLLADGHHVIGLVHEETSHQPYPQHERFIPVPGNLLDKGSLIQKMADGQPDMVFHLAGQASPGLSWSDPALTLAVNTGGTANILEAALRCGKPKVVVVSSAQIYGGSKNLELPITEATPPHPNHPYGVSKWAAGQLVSLYWQRHQLPVIEARPFNHIGPRQALGFVIPDFASQIAAIRLGIREPFVTVGNLEAERDFTDVRDVARAYRFLADKGKPGEAYLICSGQLVKIQKLLNMLIDLSGVDVEVKLDPDRMRPSEQKQIVGSYAKIHRDTGWQPEITLNQSLTHSLDEWINKLGNG